MCRSRRCAAWLHALTRLAVRCRYATTSDSQPISEFSCLIHDFYAMECQRPLQLSVDTSLLQPKLNIRAFITTPMTVADKCVRTRTFAALYLDGHCHSQWM